MTNSRFSWLESIDLGFIFSKVKRYIAAHSKVKPLLALAIALAIWALVPVFVRLVEQEISPSALAFHRFWIASLVLGISPALKFIFSRLPTPKSNEDKEKTQDDEKPLTFKISDSYQTVLALIGAAVFYALNSIAWLTSIDQTTIANSALLHNFTPIFVALIGFVLLGQRFDTRFVVGILIAIGGSTLLGWEDITYKAAQLQGDAIALASALFWAVHLLLLRRVRSLPALTVTFYCCLVGALVTAGTLLPVFADKTYSTSSFYPTSGLGWINTVLLGCGTAICTVMMAYALNFLSSSFVGVMVLIDPILSSVIAWVILSEAMSLYTLIAFPIILSGIYLSTTSPSASPSET